MRVICGCFFVLFTAVAATAAIVSGTATDFATQAPLGSMIVAAYTQEGTLQATGTTDARGQWVLNVPTGQYRFLAYDLSGAYATTFGGDADSFESSPIINVTGEIFGMNLALRRAGTITGTVAALPSGGSLSAITVAAYNLSSGTRRGFTKTAGNGTYSLVLPPGQFKIAAYDTTGAYAARFYPNQDIFASAASVTVNAGQQTASINFQLVVAGHLNGSVVDADANLILPGTSVFAYTSDGTTSIVTVSSDGAGNFRISVPPGSYKVVAADAARVYATGYVGDANSFTNEDAVSVAGGQVVSALRIPLHRAGIISGHVADTAGTPLAAITVAGYNGDGSQRASAITDSAGAYSLLLPGGSFRIAAYDNGVTYATKFYPGQNLFSQASAIPVVVAQTLPAIDFSLSRGSRFSGVITDRLTASPVSGVSIVVFDEAGNTMAAATSDASGSYALVVPAGGYKLVVFDSSLRFVTAYGGGAANYEKAAVFQVDGSSSQQVDFSLTGGVRASGMVVDSMSAFTPISGVEIGALDLAGDRVATATSRNGVFDLVLTPGTYKLLATDPMHRFHAMFYNTAWTLAAATPVVVQSNGFASPPTLLLVRQARRHASPH